MTADAEIANIEQQGPSAEPQPEPLQLPPGFFADSDVKSDSLARILVLGAMKIGKTSAIVSTAPRPLLINCDGESASLYAAECLGAKFIQCDAQTRAGWKRAQDGATTLANAGKIDTIIIDSISVLANELLSEIAITLDGFDRFRELDFQLDGGLRRLCKLPVHVIMVSHMDPGSDKNEGILPLIPGRGKRMIAAKATDWVLFRLDPDTQKREFVVGNQGTWTASGRNVRRSCTTAPTVPALFAELGIPLKPGESK